MSRMIGFDVSPLLALVAAPAVVAVAAGAAVGATRLARNGAAAGPLAGWYVHQLRNWVSAAALATDDPADAGSVVRPISAIATGLGAVLDGPSAGQWGPFDFTASWESHFGGAVDVAMEEGPDGWLERHGDWVVRVVGSVFVAIDCLPDVRIAGPSMEISCGEHTIGGRAADALQSALSAHLRGCRVSVRSPAPGLGSGTRVAISKR